MYHQVSLPRGIGNEKMTSQVLNQISDIGNSLTRGEKKELVGHWIHEDKSHFVA